VSLNAYPSFFRAVVNFQWIVVSLFGPKLQRNFLCVLAINLPHCVSVCRYWPLPRAEGRLLLRGLHEPIGFPNPGLFVSNRTIQKVIAASTIYSFIRHESTVVVVERTDADHCQV
jgi:hypothetical protein